MGQKSRQGRKLQFYRSPTDGCRFLPGHDATDGEDDDDMLQVAMDRTSVENGCMWFVLGSHCEAELRESRRVTPDVHVRMCDRSEVYWHIVSVPLLQCDFWQ